MYAGNSQCQWNSLSIIWFFMRQHRTSIVTTLRDGSRSQHHAGGTVHHWGKLMMINLNRYFLFLLEVLERYLPKHIPIDTYANRGILNIICQRCFKRMTISKTKQQSLCDLQRNGRKKSDILYKTAKLLDLSWNSLYSLFQCRYQESCLIALSYLLPKRILYYLDTAWTAAWTRGPVQLAPRLAPRQVAEGLRYIP